MRWRPLTIACCLAVVPAALLPAQSLYKYTGKDGEIIYTDRKPPDTDEVEVRSLASTQSGEVSLAWHGDRAARRLVASNTLHAPVMIMLAPDGKLATQQYWVVPAQGSLELKTGATGVPLESPTAMRFAWLFGDPDAVHEPAEPYRAPFPTAVSHRVTQAWPDAITHTTPDSRHAVDIAMPVGSNVFAARAGTVVEVASTNFRSSLDQGEQGASANVVRILHDDGTFAIYAHLNWNSIRVRPGQRVSRGEYIADSGNTGFSTGPHLHFVVLKNTGRGIESLPVRFADANGAAVIPRSGSLLVAH